MIFIQNWPKNSFENIFLKRIREVLKDKDNKKLYFGFDYGFFLGVNIYYGSKCEPTLANKVNDLFKKKKITIRLCTNIPYDFDVIVLFGCTNLIKQRLILRKNEKNILKALSKL